MPTPEQHLTAQENHLKREFPKIVGKKIVSVRPLTIRERTDYGWSPDCVELAYAIMLDDGTALVPVTDDAATSPAIIFREVTEWVSVEESKEVVKRSPPKKKRRAIGSVVPKDSGQVPLALPVGDVADTRTSEPTKGQMTIGDFITP
jgi:hypothetical protein